MFRVAGVILSGPVTYFTDELYMKCHLIQYFDAAKSLEWALLSWPDRPTSVRRASAFKAKQEAALEVVQWRYPAL
jgi:hypothetical protein